MTPTDKDEVLRLQALEDLQILDTAPEDAFEELVQVAAAICGTPISLISLVDEQRQWFKARVGLDVPETARDVAFCAHTIQQDDLFVVPDALEDVRFAQNALVLEGPEIRFYAGYPLKTEEGQAIGSLCVIDRRPRELTAVQQHALTVLARQVVTQMELRRKVRALDAVLRERDEAARRLRLSESRFSAFLDACPAAVTIKHADGRLMYCNRAITEPHGALPIDWIGLTDAQLWPEPFASCWREADLEVLRHGTPLHFKSETPREGRTPIFWSMLKFPIEDANGEQFLACVGIDITREHEIEDELQQYQQQLLQANLELMNLAVTDKLTQLKNRRAFDEALELEIARSRRSQTNLSLMLLDIDNFKSFNDTFGHVLGDQVLQQVAALIKGSIRCTDVVARYGGEEFVAILPDVSEVEAFHLATRICEIIEEAEWEWRPMTISIGVGILDATMAGSDQFVECVDKALYDAKRHGKNQAAYVSRKLRLA